MLILVVVFVGASGFSLVRIMVFEGEKYQKMATEQQLYDARITAERGNIYDSNMKVLATSAPVWTVFVTPNEIDEIKDEATKTKVKNTISEGLAPILGLEKSKIAEDMEKKESYYISIKKRWKRRRPTRSGSL